MVVEKESESLPYRMYQRASGIMFANNLGLVGNAISRGNLAVKRQLADVEESGLRKEVWEKGAVKLGKYHSQDFIDEVCKTTDELLSSDEVKEKVRDHGTRKVLTNPKFDFEQAPVINDIVTEEVLRELEGFLGAYPSPIYSSIYRYMPAEEWDITRRWHIDPYNSDSVRMFFYLDDTEEKGAPTLFLNRSQTRELFKEHSREEIFGNPDLIEENYEPRELHAEPGDIVIADTFNVLHRGTTPDKGKHRDMWHFTFTPSISPMEEEISKILSGRPHPQSTSIRGVLRSITL